MTTTIQFDRIVAEGTMTAASPREGRPSNALTCADGFKLSVIAGGMTYCAPRVAYDMAKFEEDQITGPYYEVEMGFPSERPEPWDAWSEYQDGSGDPTESVYGYVPVETVRALILSHGGEATK